MHAGILIAAVWSMAFGGALLDLLGDRRASVALAASLIVGVTSRWPRGARAGDVARCAAAAAFAAILTHAVTQVVGLAYPRLAAFVHGPWPSAGVLAVVAGLAALDRRPSLRRPSA